MTIKSKLRPLERDICILRHTYIRTDATRLGQNAIFGYISYTFCLLYIDSKRENQNAVKILFII